MSSSAADMRERLRRWPLIQQAGNRSDSFLKDQRLVNAFAEQDPTTGEWIVQKRIGYSLAYSTISSGLARGGYTWFQTPSIAPIPTAWFVVGNGANATFFRNGVALSGTVTDSGGMWNFTETQPPSSSGTRYLIVTAPGLGGSSALYYIQGTTWTAAALPAGRGAYIAGCAYLDGTIYFMDEYCNVWGSGINDPSTWTALNSITAQSIPGIGVGLVKQLTYLIALKTESMEVFYDAGNATGSPLGTVPGALNDYGCGDRNTIQVLDGILLYLTSNRNSTPQIVRVDNLVPKVVSTPQIERLIAKWSLTGITYSFAFKRNGHKFYGISNSAIGGAGLTVVYDLDQNLWYQWADAAGAFFPMFATAVDSSFNQQFAHPSNGNVYNYDGAYLQPTDAGVVTPVDIFTPNMDFGTRRLKTLQRMYFNADQTPGSLLYVQRSDDDYQSWSNYRKVDLSRKHPYIDGEGTFDRRAYHFRHSAATDFRIRSSDLQMELGTI